MTKIINSYEEAGNILREYSENDVYLRSLISTHLPDAQMILDCSDFAQLKHHGRKIRGVAERMLKSTLIGKNIEALAKTTDPSKRELLDERVCIQLESCKAPYVSALIMLYDRVKSKNK